MTVILRHEGHVAELRVEKPARRTDQFDYVDALHDLGHMPGPFVMLVDIQHRLDLAQESRKAQNLWFKASRDTLGRNCRAAAIVRLDPSPEQQRTFAGLWGFPVLVTRSRDEGLAFLASALSKPPFTDGKASEGARG